MAAQPQEGLDRLAEAAKLVETTHERWAEAEIHRLRGTLLLSMNEHAAAENSYRRALEVAQRQSAKFWELRAALDLARLWHDQGQTHRGTRSPLAHLRLVHRRLRHAGLEGGQGLARRFGAMRGPCGRGLLFSGVLSEKATL